MRPSCVREKGVERRGRERGGERKRDGRIDKDIKQCMSKEEG